MYKSLDVRFHAFPRERAHNWLIGTLKAKVPVVGDEHNPSMTGIVLEQNFESKECTPYASTYIVVMFIS